MSTSSFVESRGEHKFEITQTVETCDILAAVAPLIAERRGWTKYGLEAGAGPGAQKSTTDVEENEVTLKLFPKTAQPKQDQQQEETTKKQGVMTNIACRTCGGAHLTHMCPFKDKLAAPNPEPEMPMENTSGKYVPPSRKLGMPPTRPADEEAKTVRISNLPDQLDERALKTAFGTVGQVQRCHVARDMTGACRGFAFISYASTREADRACRELDGKAIGHLVIRVEISKKKAT